MTDERPADIEEERLTNRMQVPRFTFWVSVLLLIIGSRMMIDPDHRSVGETIQIYITLASFEVYVWLLLCLARWQYRQGLVPDVVRTGMFVIGLQAMLFMTLNELHLASPQAGATLTVVATILALAKAYVARRWLDLRIDPVLQGLILGWLVLMPLSGWILRETGNEPGFMQGPAAVFCWFAAVWASAHALLASWRGKAILSQPDDKTPWWTGWLISASLCVTMALQLLACRRGYDIDFRVTLLLPLLTAGVITALIVSIIAERHEDRAWVCVGVTALAIAIFCTKSIHGGDEPAWLRSCRGVWVHPFLLSAYIFSVLAVVAGVKLRVRRLLVAGLLVGIPTTTGHLLLHAMRWLWMIALPALRWMKKVVDSILEWRHATAVFMLAGAFVTLGLGTWLQRRIAGQTPPSPPPLPKTDPPLSDD